VLARLATKLEVRAVADGVRLVHDDRVRAVAALGGHAVASVREGDAGPVGQFVGFLSASVHRCNLPVALRSLVVILAKVVYNNRLVVTPAVFLATITSMARPRKDKSERTDVDLRVPLTESQKELIARAARQDGVDMAAWARPILLQAARARLGEGTEGDQKNR
jgi:hypothetical protein